MLDLVIDNQSVPMDDNASVTITALNPALSDDNTGKVYSYPFKLPWSPQLLHLLRHARRFDAIATAQNLSAYIQIANIILTKGFIQTNDASAKSTDKSIDVYFKKDNTAILTRLNDFKLAELCPKIVIPQTVKAEYRLKLKNPPIIGQPYFIRINNQELRYVPNSNQPIEIFQHLSDAINIQYPSVSSVYNNQLTGNLELVITLSVDFSPQMERPGMVDLGGFEYIHHSNYAHAVHRNFMSFFKSCVITPRTDIGFNWIINTEFYQGKNIDYFFPWFNYAFHYDNDPDWTIPENQPSDQESFDRSFIPFFRVSYIFERISEKLGLTAIEYEGDSAIWADLMKLMIDNHTALDNLRKDYFFDSQNSQGVEKWLNCHVPEIDPADHLPDMSAKAFVDAFANGFNLDYDVTDNKTLVFKKKNRVFGQPLWAITDFISGYQRGFKEDKGFQIRLAKIDEELETPISPLTIGEGADIIQLPFSTLQDSEEWRIVKSRRYGSTLAFGLGKKRFPLRFFFDKGLYQNRYLSSGLSTDNISLLPTGEKGLYAQFWQGSAELQSKGYPLSIERMMSPQEFHHALTFKNSKVLLMSDNGHVQAIIKEISTKINRKQAPKLLKVKMELVVI